jgi:hypothetical protein
VAIISGMVHVNKEGVDQRTRTMARNCRRWVVDAMDARLLAVSFPELRHDERLDEREVLLCDYSSDRLFH